MTEYKLRFAVIETSYSIDLLVFPFPLKTVSSLEERSIALSPEILGLHVVSTISSHLMYAC